MFATKIPTLNELIGKIWIVPADFIKEDFDSYLENKELEGMGLSKGTNFEDIVRWNDGIHMVVQRDYTETDISKKVGKIKDFAKIANGNASGDIIYVNEFNICPLCADKWYDKFFNLLFKDGP